MCIALFLFWSLYKTNRFRVAVGLFSNRSQRTSKCGKNNSYTLACGSCATSLFLRHFDVICDLLLNRRTATWNLFVNLIACNQALRGILVAGQGKEEEHATMSLEFEIRLQFPCGSPSTELVRFPIMSVKQKWAKMSANIEKHVKDQSANQHFTFWRRYSNSRDVVASSPFFSHPTSIRLPQGACSQALYLKAFLSTFSLLNVILLAQFWHNQ